MRKGAPLILTWIVEDNTIPWIHEYKELWECYDFSIPSYRSRKWEIPFSQQSGLFNHKLDTKWFRSQHPSTFEDMQTRVQSKSYIAVLTDEKKTEITRNISKYFAEALPATAKIHLNGRTLVDVTFRTEVTWTTRL